MGGANEKVLTAGTKAGGVGALISTADIRVHENKGEVHFHDDKAGKKVAIPSALFMKQFGDWADSPTAPLTMIDHNAKTQVVLSMKSVNGELDIEVVVSDIKLGKNFLALKSFAEGK